MISVSKKSILPVALVIIAALFRLSPSTSFLAYLILCLLAFVSVRGALWSLVFAWFFSTLNPELFSQGSYDTILRFAVIFSASLRVAYQGISENKRRRARFISILAFSFGIFILLHSLLFSQIASISLLKGSMWLLTILTSISGWAYLSQNDSVGLFRNIKQLSIVIAVGSLILHFTSYGYIVNETGLNGLLNHPQALGVISGIFMSIFFSEMISNSEQNIKNGISLILYSIVLILTEARTGGLAFLLSVAGMLMISIFVHRQRFSDIFSGVKLARTRIFIVMMLVSIAAFSGYFGNQISSYIVKRSNTEQLTEVYEISRGNLINQSIDNIQIYPLTGIGFGIPSDTSTLDIIYDPIFGLPISAPIEKGLVVLSATEELGFPGLILLLVLGSSMLILAIKSADVCKISLLLVIIFVNFGEAVFFSPGGTGLLVLVLLGWVIRPVDVGFNGPRGAK